MGVIGTSIWIVALLYMLHLAIPNRQIPREAESNCSYYLLWVIMLGITLGVQYEVMSGFGRGHFAVVVDVGVIGLFSVECLLIRFVRQWNRKGEPRFPFGVIGMGARSSA